MEIQPLTIGKYRIDRLLGRGGMGHVYVGVDPDLDREVAIKIVSLDSDADSRARFIREAKTMARLNHPNIVTLLEYGVQDDTPYLVIELLGGEDLSEWMRTVHPLAAQMKVMLDIALAIEAAHDGGILHRDIKPENIRVLPNGHCKLLDFGIANRAEEGHLTQSGAFVGTMNFVAPEVVSGLRHCVQSDLYSLGLLYYCMLAQSNPFTAETVAATLARVLQHAPPPLDQVRDGVPLELARLIDACLRKNPLQRPASASVLVKVLTDCLARVSAEVQLGALKPSQPAIAIEPLAQTRETPVSGSRRPTAARGKLFWLPALGVSLLIVIGLALRWSAPPAADSPPVTSGAPAPPVQAAAATTTHEPAALEALPSSSPPATAVVAPRQHDGAAPSSTAPVPSPQAPDADHRPPAVPVASAVPPPTVDKAGPASTRLASAPAAVDAAARGTPSSVPAPPAAAATDNHSSAELPVQIATILQVPSAAAVLIELPVIASGSTHLLRRGIPVTLLLRGQHLSAATAANILLGTGADGRFKIADFHLHNDGELSLRVEAPRNLPLGRYPLVLESAAGKSAPFIIEVSL